MRHVGLEFEAAQVGDVVEGHLLDVEEELALAREVTEGALAVALEVVDLDLALVALALVLLLQMQGDGMRVPVVTILRDFVGIET